jgi:hypothetical protein
MGEGMKVYFDIPFKSFGISRVVHNLGKYLPAGFETVADPAAADLVLLHVIGRRDHVLKQAQEITQSGRQYAVIQYSLESTRNPDPQDWLPLWSGAKVVWSYYDLAQYANRFYHAPLAADPEAFYPQVAEKDYLVGSNGNCYRDECIGEIHLAAYQAGGNAVHVGTNFDNNPIVDYRTNPTDDEFREVYNQCQFFSALRRKDGFEIVAIEALLCGVRPIMFDAPRFRQWFDGLAEFVPECDPGELAGRLKKIFRDGPRPVTDAEIAETKSRFDWKRSVSGFWERCLLPPYPVTLRKPNG